MPAEPAKSTSIFPGCPVPKERKGRELVDFERGRLPEGAAADRLVERALFLAATGYTYVEERVETAEKTGEKVTKTRKQVAPSVTAIALWLSHRVPERWGDGATEATENNLLTLLREELRGGERIGVSSLQPETAAGTDLVESAPAGAEGRDSLRRSGAQRQNGEHGSGVSAVEHDHV